MIRRSLFPRRAWRLTPGVLLALAACDSAKIAKDVDDAAFAVCPGDNAGLTLPPGFCATIFADNVGHARHLAIAEDGTVYVNTWSGPYYGNDTPRVGGFLTVLKDTDGDGHANVEERFGPGLAEISTGGTGIMLHGGWLYAEVKDRIVRWRRPEGSLALAGEPEVIVSNLPSTGAHPMHQFVIDAENTLFVNVGSASNVCEVKAGTAQPKGHDPCAELETRAGVWRFRADRTGQVFSPAARYATGIRNIGGMRINDSGKLVVSQHGRDLLAQNWPTLYTVEHGANLPAEQLIVVEEGGDYGWPACYFDGRQKKLILAPEYGGDGGKAVGICKDKLPPVAHFPAHWAPNDILFYRGTMFPRTYREGVFIAFHGSWNRAPMPQDGFRIVFQPMTRGVANGKFVHFADGFAGKARPDTGAYRPSGLQVGPDGALYVTDDNRGRVWRITYNGPRNAGVMPAPPPDYRAQPEANSTQAQLPVPPGVSAAEVALGRRIFNGEEKDGTCSGCHGVDGVGGMASSFTSSKWLWSDGSLAGIEKSIRDGIAQPKENAGAMPPMGGAALTEADARAVAAYVWAIGQR